MIGSNGILSSKVFTMKLFETMPSLTSLDFPCKRNCFVSTLKR